MSAAMDDFAHLTTSELRAAVTSAPTATRWRSASVALLCLLLAILLLYRDTAIEMVSIWHRSATFTHAFLVPPIVLLLVWRRRATLTAMRPQPTMWALLPVAVFVIAWQIGDLANLNAVTQFSMTALLVSAVVGVIGLKASRAIAFPLAFLFFAVPMGEVFVPLLMEWTASFTIFALRLTGIPVLRDGLSFVIPSGSWSVVEACSGVRYLIASFMVGTLFAHLNYQTMQRRLTFMGVSLVVPIIANWLRAYLIVVLGHVSGNKLAAGVDHLIYGWIFFGIVIMLMFWIGAKWAQPERKHEDLASVPTSPPHAPGRDVTTRPWIVAVAAGLLAAAPHSTEWLAGRALPSQPRPELQVPDALSDRWAAVPDKPIDWKPAFVNAAAEIDRVYSNGERNVGLYVGYYRHQTQGRKLIGSTNVLVRTEDHVWAAADGGTRTVNLAGRPLALRATSLGTRFAVSGELLVWRIYWVDGGFTSSELAARARIALGKLIGHGDDAAVVVLYTTMPDADKTLQGFAEANLPSIETLLLKTRGAQR